jgi:hypothetical protein
VVTLAKMPGQGGRPPEQRQHDAREAYSPYHKHAQPPFPVEGGKGFGRIRTKARDRILPARRFDTR